jgi:hypothetical protein
MTWRATSVWPYHQVKDDGKRLIGYCSTVMEEREETLVEALKAGSRTVCSLCTGVPVHTRGILLPAWPLVI